MDRSVDLFPYFLGTSIQLIPVLRIYCIPLNELCELNLGLSVLAFEMGKRAVLSLGSLHRFLLIAPI